MKAADIAIGARYVTGDPRDWRAALADPATVVNHGRLVYSFTIIEVTAHVGRSVDGRIMDSHSWGSETGVILGRVLAHEDEFEDLKRRGEQLVADEKAARRAREIAAEEARGWADLPLNDTRACTRCGVPIADWRGESVNRDRHEKWHGELDELRQMMGLSPAS